MSTTTKSKSRPGLDEAPTAPARYDKDLYGWVEAQVALLRANEVSSIDVSQLTQELTDLGRSEFGKLVSSLRLILQHLLKWDHQPERRSRSWANTIEDQRDWIKYRLGDSPSLKPRIQEATNLAYRLARRAAALETMLPDATFPETCPYDWNDITQRPVLWDQSLPNPR
jgi:hypothetical protein